MMRKTFDNITCRIFVLDGLEQLHNSIPLVSVWPYPKVFYCGETDVTFYQLTSTFFLVFRFVF